MTIAIERPTAGHLPLCLGCRHHLADLPSHPTPCGAIRWREGFTGRHVPNLSADGDGVVCSDFTPLQTNNP